MASTKTTTSKRFAVVDVGNTGLGWGISESSGDLVPGGRLSHAEAFDLGRQLRERGAGDIPVVVASVNPRPLADLSRGLGRSPCLLEAEVNWHPVSRVERPAEVGIDRLVNARAIRDRCPDGGIVVDHGTALTIDYVEPGGVYAGGTIVPGIGLSLRSLAENTALIPLVDFSPPDSVVGKTTESCIQAGLYWGLVGLVDSLVGRIREEKGAELPVLVTGGDSGFLVRETRQDWEHDPLLTLRGVALAARDAGLVED